MRQEALHFEYAIFAEHQIDSSSELGRKNGKSLGFAVPTREAAKLPLPLWVATQEEDGGLRERPLEVHVPDLRASGAKPLPGRCVVALHQSAVREEVLHSRESTDVVDLVEDRQCQDLPDAGHRLQTVIGLGVVLSSSSLEVVLHILDDHVVLFDECEVHLHALARIAFTEGLGDSFAIGLVGDLGFGGGKVVLVMGVLDMGEL